MLSEEQKKREKAKQMRFKKPIAKHMNLDYIREKLWDIQEECEDVRWYTADGSDLLEELVGDEDEAYEFKMEFATLCAECEQMRYDLEEEWIPQCFDIFFATIAKDEMLGWDSWEGDYMGIGDLEIYAEDEAKKQLKRMTKDELIDAARQCLRVYSAFVGLENRYDNLKAAIDILRNKNAGHLQIVKKIEKMYEAAVKDDWMLGRNKLEYKMWKEYTDALPQEAWIA